MLGQGAGNLHEHAMRLDPRAGKPVQQQRRRKAAVSFGQMQDAYDLLTLGLKDDGGFHAARIVEAAKVIVNAALRR
jgi:hypothetical protein